MRGEIISYVRKIENNRNTLLNNYTRYIKALEVKFFEAEKVIETLTMDNKRYKKLIDSYQRFDEEKTGIRELKGYLANTIKKEFDWEIKTLINTNQRLSEALTDFQGKYVDECFKPLWKIIYNKLRKK